MVRPQDIHLIEPDVIYTFQQWAENAKCIVVCQTRFKTRINSFGGILLKEICLQKGAQCFFIPSKDIERIVLCRMETHQPKMFSSQVCVWLCLQELKNLVSILSEKVNIAYKPSVNLLGRVPSTITSGTEGQSAQLKHSTLTTYLHSFWKLCRCLWMILYGCPPLTSFFIHKQKVIGKKIGIHVPYRTWKYWLSLKAMCHTTVHTAERTATQSLA